MLGDRKQANRNNTSTTNVAIAVKHNDCKWKDDDRQS